MLSAPFNMHNCDTKIRLLLAKPYRSKWEGRTLTPTYFSHTKVGGSSSTKGWVRPPKPPANHTLGGPQTSARSPMYVKRTKWFISYIEVYGRCPPRSTPDYTPDSMLTGVIIIIGFANYLTSPMRNYLGRRKAREGYIHYWTKSTIWFTK